MELTPIKESEFRKKIRGCGIKNYNQIQKTELKALLGFRPTRKPKKNC